MKFHLILGLLLLCTPLAFSQDQETGSIYVAELTGANTESVTQERVRVLYRPAGGGKVAAINASAQIPAEASAQVKAQAIAQAINDSPDNETDNGDDPQPLVKAQSLGHTFSIVGLNGVTCKGLNVQNATRQRGCRVTELDPGKPGPQRSGQAGTLQPFPGLSRYALSGTFSGLALDGSTSELDIGVLTHQGERSVTIQLQPGGALSVASELHAALSRLGVPSKISRGPMKPW